MLLAMKTKKTNEDISQKPLRNNDGFSNLQIHQPDSNYDDAEKFDKNNISESDMDKIFAISFI